MKRFSLLTALLVFFLAGCGGNPAQFGSRAGFPPWEKLPEGNGIHYLEKYTRDHLLDPLYLAKFSYDDEAALANVINTFQLVPHDGQAKVSTFTGTITPSLNWFPLPKVTEIYVYPENEDHEYVSTLWVDTKNQVAVIERTWW